MISSSSSIYIIIIIILQYRYFSDSVIKFIFWCGWLIYVLSIYSETFCYKAICMLLMSDHSSAWLGQY